MSIIPSVEDPLPAHRFLVSLDPTDAYLPFAQSAIITAIAAGQFSEVTGLGADLEVLAHPEGGRNDYVHQLPVRHSYPKIVLSRGMVRDPGLYFWYQAGLSRSIGARRDGAIILLTPGGVPAIGWIFRGGLAAAWKGPQLKGSDSAIAVESIEIAHEGLLQVPLTPPRVG
ncbi:phage tail protein [Terrabacter sp. RAF57]|uniref:phage tail protein n=1 Tax=Terrabacter sp. RAF57 TaxID=3233063 RepID=UPI003F946057